MTQVKTSKKAENLKIYQRAIATHLERSLTDSRIRLWADAFSSNENVRQRSLIFFGLRSGRYQTGLYDPFESGYQQTLQCTFELQALLYTLHSHEDALMLIFEAMETLRSYQPYVEFEPIIPNQFGEPRYDKNNGVWSYGADCTAVWNISDELTAIESVQPEPRIVKVGLINISAIAGNQVDREWNIGVQSGQQR